MHALGAKHTATRERHGSTRPPVQIKQARGTRTGRTMVAGRALDALRAAAAAEDGVEKPAAAPAAAAEAQKDAEEARALASLFSACVCDRGERESEERVREREIERGRRVSMCVDGINSLCLPPPTP